jgi:hypothetical protein
VALWVGRLLPVGGIGLEREDRRLRVGCFQARRGGSSPSFCDEDAGHGLLEASTVRSLSQDVGDTRMR